MSSGHRTRPQDLLHMVKPVQRSPPESMYENLHCRSHFFKENSREQTVVPFFFPLDQLRSSAQNNPYTLGFFAMREVDHLFPGWKLASVQKLTACSVAHV